MADPSPKKLRPLEKEAMDAYVKSVVSHMEAMGKQPWSSEKKQEETAILYERIKKDPDGIWRVNSLYIDNQAYTEGTELYNAIEAHVKRQLQKEQGAGKVGSGPEQTYPEVYISEQKRALLEGGREVLVDNMQGIINEYREELNKQQ